MKNKLIIFVTLFVLIIGIVYIVSMASDGMVSTANAQVYYPDNYQNNPDYYSGHGWQYYRPTYPPQYPYYYPYYYPYQQYGNVSPLRVTCGGVLNNYNNYNNYYGNYWNYGYNNSYVKWTAYVSGGPNYYYYGSTKYNYTWSGTDNPRGLDMDSINVYYQTSGNKDMYVTVHSIDGQTVTAYCGSVYFNYPQYQPMPYPMWR